MLEKIKRASRIVVAVWLSAGFLIIVALAMTPRMVIGPGRFEAFLAIVERFDFKWWLTGAAATLWLLAVIAVVAFDRAKKAGLAVTDLSTVVRDLLAEQTVPVLVDVDQKIPIQLDEPLQVPVELHTQVDIDSDVDLDTEVPFCAELPVDTNIETSVLGLGTVNIPVRARLPVDVVVPFKGRTRVKATGIPIHLTEIGVAQLPAVEIPIRARIEARIDLLSNLESAEAFLVRPERSWLDDLKQGLTRLRRVVFK